MKKIKKKTQVGPIIKKCREGQTVRLTPVKQNKLTGTHREKKGRYTQAAAKSQNRIKGK